MRVERIASRGSPGGARGAVISARPLPEVPPKPPLLRRRRFLIAASVLALAMAALIFMGVRFTAMYHMDVGELLAQGSAAYGEKVRLGGKVVDGSVESPSSGNEIRFNLTDGTQSVPVVYRGVVPDAFEPGADVVMDGALSPSGTFEASSLLAKCPSKYVPAP
jgi:cytochrome c-type biogenesis protein CcmE